MNEIEFIDLDAQRTFLGGGIEKAISRVLDHGHYIMGPEVAELEESLAREGGRRHCISCGSGTEALQLALMVLGVGSGDRVVVPDFTFVATAEAVCLVGAEPVFADIIASTYNIDPDSVASAWDLSGPPPVGIIAVDLFGQPSVTPELEDLAKRLGVWIIVDAAQSFGSLLDNRSSVSYGEMATTSFYPSKPLGSYGDGGAIFCDDDELAAALVSLRNHGVDSNLSRYGRVGLNSRLDTLQAAVLLPKLEVLNAEIQKREVIARRYSEALGGLLTVPEAKPGTTSAWAQYTVQFKHRDSLRSLLAESGIPTRVFYPDPVHAQPAYSSYPLTSGGTPVATSASLQVLSLPMYPYLDASTQDRIVASAISAIESLRDGEER